MSTRILARRITSTLALLTLPLVGVAGTASVAHADEASGTGSITVVDYHNADTMVVPVQNAVFTVSRVKGIDDPRTDEGSTLFAEYRADLSAGNAAAIPTSSVSTPAPTSAGGSTTAEDLPIGAYLVHEKGVLDASGNLVAATYPVPDTLVSIPTEDSGTTWYDVTIVPKTDIDAPVPTIPASTSTPSTTPSASSTPTGTATAHRPGTTTTVTVPVPTSTVAVPEYQGGTGTTTGQGGTSTGTTTGQSGSGSSQSTHINSGDGADFTGGSQWATIAFAVALVAVVFFMTGRRRREREDH